MNELQCSDIQQAGNGRVAPTLIQHSLMKPVTRDSLSDELRLCGVPA